MQSSQPAAAADPTEHYIEVVDVTHVYGGTEKQVKAIEDISIQVDRNELCCILGPSGCGKSTLLRNIAGLRPPTSGAVYIDGEPVQGVPKSACMIFQDYDNTLMKWKTVFDNVAIGAELRGLKGEERDEVVSRQIELVGLEEFADHYPGSLSGGMKQRVQVARVLCYDPDILLCDEPFGALDLQTKDQLQEEFLEILHHKAATTIFVTHDIEEAIYLGDVIYILKGHNPGQVSEIERIDFDRPRFPKADFERDHQNEIIERRLDIAELLRTD